MAKVVNVNAVEHARIADYLDRRLGIWQARMGLGHWEIEMKYLDSFDSAEESDDDFHTTMETHSKPDYLIAYIKVYMPSALRWNDTALDKTLVHELCHVMLSPEQNLVTKDADMGKVELSTELTSRAIYRAWEIPE